MNTLHTQISQLKTLTFSTLLKNSFKGIIKNKYFDNTFSSNTFREIFYSTLIENGFKKIDIGFEDRLLKEFTK